MEIIYLVGLVLKTSKFQAWFLMTVYLQRIQDKIQIWSLSINLLTATMQQMLYEDSKFNETPFLHEELKVYRRQCIKNQSISILFLKPKHQRYQISWELVTKADADSVRQAGPNILHSSKFPTDTSAASLQTTSWGHTAMKIHNMVRWQWASKSIQSIEMWKECQETKSETRLWLFHTSVTHHGVYPISTVETPEGY